MIFVLCFLLMFKCLNKPTCSWHLLACIFKLASFNSFSVFFFFWSRKFLLWYLLLVLYIFLLYFLLQEKKKVVSFKLFVVSFMSDFSFLFKILPIFRECPHSALFFPHTDFDLFHYQIFSLSYFGILSFLLLSSLGPNLVHRFLEQLQVKQDRNK